MRFAALFLVGICGAACARETHYGLPTPPDLALETGTEVLAVQPGLIPIARPDVQVLGGENKTVEVTISGFATLTAIVYPQSPADLGLPVGKLTEAFGDDSAPLPEGGTVYTLQVESEEEPGDWVPGVLSPPLANFRYLIEREPETCGAFLPGPPQVIDGDRIIALLPEHEYSALLVAGLGAETFLYRLRPDQAERIGPVIPNDVEIVDASINNEWLYLAGRARSSSTAALLRLPLATFDAIERLPMPGPGLRAVANVGETDDLVEQSVMYALDDDGRVVRLEPSSDTETSTRTAALLPRVGLYPASVPGQLTWMGVKSLFAISPYHTTLYGVSAGEVYERSPNRRGCSIERLQKGGSGLRVGTRCGEVYAGSELERIGPSNYGSPVLDQMAWGRGALAIQDNAVVQFRDKDTCPPIPGPDGTTLLRILPVDQLSIMVAGRTAGPSGEPKLYVSVWPR